MFSARMLVVGLSIFAYLLLQTTCNAQLDIDEETGCPLNVEHVCEFCSQDQNRFGCYCEDDGAGFVTANLYTKCPANDTDPCAVNPCQGASTCTREGLSGYKCTCAPGLGGTICNETLAKCDDANVKCRNAECFEQNDPLMPVYCLCYDGKRVDPTRNQTCPLSPCYEMNSEIPVCQNNGTCRIINNAHICECRGGFGGQNCTKPLAKPLCETQPSICGEGVCQQSISRPLYSCNCKTHPGIFGNTLDKLYKCEESGCYAANPCQNGGTCANGAKGAFSCQCPIRFTGSKCEKPSGCFANPCINGGICESANTTTYFCKCSAYFTGQNCQTPVPDPCKTKNCGPYGACRDIRGVAVCLCSDGIHGDNSPCQDPCTNFSCGPGVCTRKANATYEAVCSCPPSRDGKFCELPKDVCRTAARCGGGYCKPNYAANRGYSCVCTGGIVKNEPCPFLKNCPIKDCGDKGVCVETDGIIIPPSKLPIYYVCSCSNGYITSSGCDVLINTKIPAATAKCGDGEAYASRNPNNPIGCWCKNGTHIEEIEEDGTGPYCV